ncbi:hypothetical protein CEUSTIGMA_g10603.t1 [Chlamydomonas eustigma]|uniref:Cyclic nucleotide-binding domain-containing protein n=1 Tax=Chlamydomonas eustigma TaxID=1157962 RepID=A0A250XJC7_9CHLO|nr:hypothetical protein CEUSTIGMA_g10603.t1 [Chlamydomonas eustigma]|eukprot:GAX83177.1 hypothetical protein CEUSTIGMA_g10603.t1 [Chlamydomonas eustigma]
MNNCSVTICGFGALFKGVHFTDTEIWPMSGSAYERIRGEDFYRSDGPDPWLIDPNSSWYQIWWTVTVAAAFLTAFIEPLMLSFKSYPGLYPYDDAAAFAEYFLLAIFAADIVINFYLPVVERRRMKLITDLKLIRKKYCRKMFRVDLVGLVPWDLVAMALFEVESKDNKTASVLALLKWFKLVRCYRIFALFQFHEQHNKVVSQLMITLARNITPIYVQYIFSLYFSITTFATVGFGDFRPVSVVEVGFVICFMMFNVMSSAYIIGTITLLVVRSDERTREYRERMLAVNEYKLQHNIPKSLFESMTEHVELFFRCQEHSDERVLASLPSTIRRRTLRHLYLPQIQHCYLFKGAKQKLIDAILAAGRVELYMPQVEVVSEGDHVNDLYILLQGGIELLNPRLTSTLMTSSSSASEDLLLGETGASKHGGRRMLLLPGDCFSEVSFFTQIPNLEAARTLDVCRVMLVSRAAYDSISKDFLLGGQQVLTNLLNRCMERERLEVRIPRDDTQDGYYRHQQAVVDLARVRCIVMQHSQHVSESRVFEFLSAASRGDEGMMRRMLEQGHEINACDYDNRSALMLSCAKGHTSCVRALLESGADCKLRDSSGSCALMEACKSSNASIITDLLRHGAKLNMEAATLAGHLCRAVHDGDMRFLYRMIHAGANMAACDYDMRSALHVAAAEGNLAAVKMLVGDGNAPISVLDRFGNSPLDEARRVGAQTVVDFLESCVTELEQNQSLAKFIRQRTTDLLQACACGDVIRVRSLLERHVPPDCADYDNRTGMMLAAVKGHLEVVQELLRWGGDPAAKDNFGTTAKSEAVKYGWTEIVQLLQREEELKSMVA